MNLQVYQVKMTLLMICIIVCTLMKMMKTKMIQMMTMVIAQTIL